MTSNIEEQLVIRADDVVFPLQTSLSRSIDEVSNKDGQDEEEGEVEKRPR